MGPIQKQFESLLGLLNSMNARFALAGGYAASLYRRQERFTKDIDILLWTEGNVIENGVKILKKLGLEAHEVREAELKGGPLHKVKSKSTPVWILAGRSQERSAVAVDLLLHLFPWMPEALSRAQKNQHDIGFGWRIPIVTAEDLLLSKFMALQDNQSRVEDISDIKEIFLAQELDIVYLIDRMKQHSIACPKSIYKFVPKVVRTTSKEIHGKK